VSLSRSPTSQFLRFALVGTAGFIVDSGVLYLAMGLLHANHYSGRLLSFLTAATFTWAMNRRYTFADRRGAHLPREWLKFLAANSLGGAANYGVYALLVTASAFISDWPVIGVAAGSLVGLALNFCLSRQLVFNQRSS
jgi:putative flippase GtrA